MLTQQKIIKKLDYLQGGLKMIGFYVYLDEIESVGSTLMKEDLLINFLSRRSPGNG